MLTMSKEIQEQIQAHGVESYPYEGCGLLLGTADHGNNIVAAIRPAQNAWPNEEEKRIRFRIDEVEWVKVELEAIQQGVDVVGIFHSHPDSPAEASPRDLAWAAFAGYSYLIMEIRQGVPGDGRSWQLLSDRSGFVEEEVKIK